MLSSNKSLFGCLVHHHCTVSTEKLMLSRKSEGIPARRQRAHLEINLNLTKTQRLEETGGQQKHKDCKEDSGQSSDMRIIMHLLMPDATLKQKIHLHKTTFKECNYSNSMRKTTNSAISRLKMLTYVCCLEICVIK